MRQRAPIDPALRRFLDEQAAASLKVEELTNDERVRAGRALMLRARESRGPIPGLPNGVESRDVAITTEVQGRVYLPPGEESSVPALVYMHGGGWTFGSIATHDPFCRLLSGAAGVMVVSVDYRLAPEHRYPAALEDAIAAVRWAAECVGEWGGDGKRLALGGDSAGANLAAVAANRLCAEGKTCGLAALMLLYPVADYPNGGHSSYEECATGYGLEASQMRWFWNQYAPDGAPEDPELSPLRLPKLPPLPPTLVVTAEYDVLRDEGLAYARKLEVAGVRVTHLHTPDLHHNTPVHPGTVARFPQCDQALQQIAKWLQMTLHKDDVRPEESIRFEPSLERREGPD